MRGVGGVNNDFFGGVGVKEKVMGAIYGLKPLK